MSIDEIDKIDIVSTAPNGDIQLTIADHYDWHDERHHILLLQDKINSYLQYVENGAILEKYPQAQRSQVLIEVAFKFEPTEFAFRFLENCKEIVTELGIKFGWRTFATIK